MILVTGGAGFIGSNIVLGLNARGITDIVVVDDLSDGHKCLNLADAIIFDYFEKDDFLKRLERGQGLGDVEAIFHQGACSATTEWNGSLLVENNFAYSKALYHWAVNRGVPFYYASSASVYGSGVCFSEDPRNERPLNAYAWSKLIFDQYVRRESRRVTTPVVGLRYFNVYGPREQHKGSMASVAYHFQRQLKSIGRVKLFEGCDGFGNGEQCRDFVYVDDVVDVNLWMLDHPEVSGIFNCGTGRAQSFNEVAAAIISHYGSGNIEYVAFPEGLQGRYQSFTQADVAKLRTVGYKAIFTPVADGISRYMKWIDEN